MVAETPQQQPQAAGAIVAVGEARSAASGLPRPDLEGVKQIITQTKAIGVILPPPDIRAIVDKTAQFVAKNGLEFERRIMASEASNAKFNFLTPTDPYHAYYRMRVKHFQEPEDGAAADGAAAKEAGTTAAAAAAATAAAAQHAEAAAAAAAAAAAPATVTTRPLEKPEDEKYTVHVPEGLTGLDLDLIKLTAQFVARNGAAFLTGLTQREASNPQFYFLKPTHSMFGFFTGLADAYSAVLMPDKGLRERLAADAADRSVILERCLKRLEWDKVRAREAQELEDEMERERIAMQQIDWHDFVVVETIDFYEDEDEELPPPMSLKELVAYTKQQALGGGPAAAAAAAAAVAAEEAAAAQQAANGGVTMDDQERALLAASADAAGEGAAAAAAAGSVTAAPELPEEVMEDDMEIDEGPIKVVKNYKRQTQRQAVTAGGVAYDPSKFAVSPITGELIAHADMAEHMRVSLLDPRWKEQKEAMLSKIKDTTKADDDEITRNLIGLAKTRPDIFGSTEEELRDVVTAAVKEKQTSGQGRAVAWDGQTMGGVHLQHQLQNIRDNRQQLGATSSSSGMPDRPVAGPTGSGTTLPPAAIAAAAAAAAAAQPPPVLPPPPASLPPPPAGGAAGQQQQPPGSQQQRLPPPPQLPPPMGHMGPPPGHMGGHMGGPPPFRGMGMPPLPGMGMGMPPPPMGMMRPMGGMPPPPGMQRPGDEPGQAAKRPRLDFVLTPEEDFLAQHGDGPSKVRVQCPEVEGNEKLVGQLLEVEVASLTDTIGHLKARLEAVTGLPPNKQKLLREGVGFLGDASSLAHYNVGPEIVLTLSTKERGGRKK